MPIISVVIPVYQAEHSLQELYKRLITSLETISQNFEIILVDDCSDDRSWEIILQLAHLDNRVIGLKFSKNFGQHYGITAGIDHCTGEWVVVMDCDLQDRPEEIPNLYKKAQEGFDVVLAKRGSRRDPLLKRLSSWFFYKVFNYLSDIKHDGDVGNFRIISKKVAKYFRLMREQLRFYGGLIDWMGFPTAYIYVSHDKSFAGKSTYIIRKLIKLALETIIAYSDKPLRLSIKFGFILSAASFMYGCYSIYKALTVGTPVLGWSSLIVSIFFLGGVIIAILGILGIYLGKTFDETKKRPLYIISDSIDNRPQSLI